MPRKRKNLKSPSTPSISPLTIQPLKRSVTQEYTVNARDVISLKFISCIEDLNSSDGFFNPVYVHQLFNNEKIIGYSELSIQIFFSQPSLYAYIKIEYEKKLTNHDTTNIVAVFKNWIKAGFTQNKQEFIKLLDEPYNPVGNLQAQFIRPDLDYDPNASEDIGSTSTDIDILNSNDSSSDNDDNDDDISCNNKNNRRRYYPRRTQLKSSSTAEKQAISKAASRQRSHRKSRKIVQKASNSHSNLIMNVNTNNNTSSTPRRSRRNRTNNRKKKDNDNDSDASGNDGDDDTGNDTDTDDSTKIMTPREKRRFNRKRKIDALNKAKDKNIQHPSKKRKLTHNTHTTRRNNDDYSESDEEDQKKDLLDQQSDNDNKNNNNSKNKNRNRNQIVNSKYSITDDKFVNDDVVYEIRLSSFADPIMREYHLRLQFFVLLYIESSSFLDLHDEIWEVMTLNKRIRIDSNEYKYEILGYLTLYKFYAYPDKKRLRISQVIIFPPFQRRGHGFEMLQHVYKMAIYRNFIEVNVEDPGEGFQFLRDITDVYNAYIYRVFNQKDFNVVNLTTYHQQILNKKYYNNHNQSKSINNNNNNNSSLSYSPHKRKLNGYSNNKICKYNKISLPSPLYKFITQHQKVSRDIYHSAIMNGGKLLKITPEQSRIAYECLKLENINADDDNEYKLYRLDIKRRLYSVLNLENIHNYDETAIFARLTQEFNKTITRYVQILSKRDQWIKDLNDWNKTHQYPDFIKSKLKVFYNKNKLYNKITKRRRH